jgi:hypothetical protein
MKRYILVAGISLALLGCSDNSQNDAGNKGDTGIPPDIDTSCGPGIYPCGPYGTKIGETAANMAFTGIMDADEQCKKDSAKKHDTSQERTISFKDYYLGSSKPGCSGFKKTLLWIMVSSGWCGPCQNEVQKTAGTYSNDDWYPKAALINVVVDNTTLNSPADTAFIKNWAARFNATFPVVKDPTFQMGKYQSRSNMPYNLLIDLRTMKIYYQQVGGNLANVEQKVRDFK